MQAQSRLAMTGGAMAPEDEHEAVIRELTRGRQLTAQLRAEALSALRGQGQAEATAALILQEVSRAFNVCLSIMSSPTTRAPPPPPETIMPGGGRLSPTAAELPAGGGPRRNREDSIPREQKVTSSPHYDGYQWRKYGQKRITKTHYPRCYYRCSFHRERNCRATKQVQQCSAGDPPQYLVMYFNDHTCDTAATWEPESSSAAVLDMSGGGGLVPLRGVQEEHQVLVDSLASVLGGHQFHQSLPPPPDAVARTCDAPAADASAGVDSAAAAGRIPRLDDMDVVGPLDVMDYDDVTAELCFGGGSYGLPDGAGLPFC